MLEKQILGAALLDKEAAEKVVTELTEEHFTTYKHVFVEMINLTKDDKDIDVTALSKNIHISVLSGLANSVNTSAYIDTHIKELQERKHLNDLDIYVKELQEKVKIGNIKEIHKYLSNIPQTTEQKIKHQNTVDLLQSVINDVGTRFKLKDDIRGLRTGYYDLDEMVGGLKQGEIIGVLADPNVGKSLLALNIACNVAERGNRVDFFAYEMSNKQIGYRVLPSLSQIEVRALSKPKIYLKDSHIQKISKFDDRKIFDNLNVYADELVMNTVTEIKTKVNQATLKLNKKSDLIIVDYLQLLTGDGEEWEQSGNNIKLLKGLARHYQIPIIVIVSKAKDGSIRGSGQIEFDLDQRWEIKREHDAKSAVERSATELIVKKNRDGGKGKVYLTYDERFLKFESKVG
jgi:replicative DNA helicase